MLPLDSFTMTPSPSIALSFHSWTWNDKLHTYSSTSQDLIYRRLNTSEICHLELFNARGTQVMDPHHCGEAEAPEDRLGLCRDSFMLAEAVGYLSHVLLCESKDFRLLEGSTRRRRDHYCGMTNTLLYSVSHPSEMTYNVSPPYLSCSSLMRNPFDRKYSAKESQDWSSFTKFLTSDKFTTLPSLVHFSSDSLALETSSWIQPSSASRKHAFLKWCSMLFWGS